MIHIPDEFKNIPEAEALRRADAEFTQALEEEVRALKAFRRPRWIRFWRKGDELEHTGQRVRATGEALDKALQSFDAATGEPKPADLTQAVIAAVEKQFTLQLHPGVQECLRRSCGRTLPLLREATPEQLDRVRLAAIKLSRGDFEDLRLIIARAHEDWRDIVHAADSMPKED